MSETFIPLALWWRWWWRWWWWNCVSALWEFRIPAVLQYCHKEMYLHELEPDVEIRPFLRLTVFINLYLDTLWSNLCVSTFYKWGPLSIQCVQQFKCLLPVLCTVILSWSLLRETPLCLPFLVKPWLDWMVKNKVKHVQVRGQSKNIIIYFT